MSEILELEYRGLNLLDEISTVEIAIDVNQKVIHVFDMNQVVEPELNFTKNKYQLSEGFYKMAKALNGKRFLVNSERTLEQWVNEITWIFYGSKQSILKYEAMNTIEIPKIDILNNERDSVHQLYLKYAERVL